MQPPPPQPLRRRSRPAPVLPSPSTRQLSTGFLSCHRDLAGSDRNTVSLLHGTTANVEANWSWTREPTPAEKGRPYCTVEPPNNGMQDVRVSAENLSHATRTVYAETGRKVDLVGHSQGGMI